MSEYSSVPHDLDPRVQAHVACLEAENHELRQRITDMIAKYTPPMIAKRATQILNPDEKVDQVDRWLRDTRMIDSGMSEWVWMSRPKLHLEYVQWCVEHGERYMETNHSLAEVLKRLRCVVAAFPVRREDLRVSGAAYGKASGFRVPPLKSGVSRYTGRPLTD